MPDTTPTHTPRRVIRATGCGECLLYRPERGAAPDYCGGTEPARPIGPEWPAPVWCPLREGPVTLELIH